MNFAPFRAASPANAAASPRRFVKTTRNEPNCERKSLAICGHASPVLPLADDGLTITTDIFLLPITDCRLPVSFRFGNWQLATGNHPPITFTELSDLLHYRVRNLFVGPQSIGFLQVLS